MKVILQKTAFFVFTYYRYILIVSAVASIIFVSLIFKIEMKTDLMDVMPDDNPSMKLFAETLNDSQRMNALTIVIDSGNEDINQHTEFIEQLARKISNSPLISGVDFSIYHLPWDFLLKYFPLFMDEQSLVLLGQRLSTDGINNQIRRNYRVLTSLLSSPADAKMISEDPLDIRSLFKKTPIMKSKITGIDLSSGYYFSKDHTKAFIFVTPNGSARNFLFVKKLKTEINNISHELLKTYEKQNNLTIESAGGFAITWEAQESIRQDMLVSFLITVLLVILIFRLIYRGQFTGLLVISITIAMALLVTLTSAFALFKGLNLVSALVSAMLIGLGFDYALHIFDRYAMEFKRHGNSFEALETTFKNTGKSIITSSLTTAFAFFSIVITSFKGLHELGIIAGIGVIACMFSSIIIQGSLLIWMSNGRFKHMLLPGSNHIIEEIIPHYIIKYKKLFLVILCGTVLVLSLGILKLEFDSDISKIGLKHSRVLELQKSLFAVEDSTNAPLILTYRGENKFDETFNDMEHLLKKWTKNGVIGGRISLSSIIPPPHEQHLAIQRLKDIYSNSNNLEKVYLAALNHNNFVIENENSSYIKNILSALQINNTVGINELPDSLRDKANIFYNQETGRMVAYVYPANNQWDKTHIVVLKEDLKNMDEGWQITGWQLLETDLKRTIIKESLTAALLSFLFIVIILYIYFRKAIVIFLVQLPLLFGIVCTLGIMGFFNLSFNYINLSAVAIIFGISVDYGVYFMQSFLEKKNSQDTALVRHAFKNITICSLTTMAGFGSLIYTNFRGISSLGSVIIIGIIACLIMSAALLPISDRLLKHNQ